MKTLYKIQQEAEKGDYTRVARLTGVSASLVKKVIYDERTDYHNIQKTFSDLLLHREALAAREQRRRDRLAA